jgi:hypothetical protein
LTRSSGLRETAARHQGGDLDSAIERREGIEELSGQFPRECPFGVVFYPGRSVLPLTEHAAAVPLAAFFAP